VAASQRFVVIVIGWLLVRSLFVEDDAHTHTTPFIASIINIHTHTHTRPRTMCMKAKLQAIIDAPLKRLSRLSFFPSLSSSAPFRLVRRVFLSQSLSFNRQSKLYSSFSSSSFKYAQWATTATAAPLHRSTAEGRVRQFFSFTFLHLHRWGEVRWGEVRQWLPSVPINSRRRKIYRKKRVQLSFIERSVLLNLPFFLVIY